MAEAIEPGLRLGMNATFLSLAAGGALVLFGRRLYFLLLTVAGFAVGFYLAHRLGIDADPTARWIIGALFGVALGLLALVLHKTVLAVVGFLLGALATIWVLEMWLQSAGPVGWIVVIVGGVLAAVLMPTLFDAGLVLLSSVIGARLLVDGLGDLGMPGPWVPWVFLALVLVGLMVQWRSDDDEDEGRRRRRRRRRRDDDD